MTTEIFVFGFPPIILVENVQPQTFKMEMPKKVQRVERKCFEDLTPQRFKNHSFSPPAPLPQWGIGGKPANEDLRFGAEFAIDEPRRSNYTDFSTFKDDHNAFDKFVTAGEDCVNRGLARPNGVTPNRCRAIRKELNEAPPMNIDLIGETDWWDEEDLDWNF